MVGLLGRAFAQAGMNDDARDLLRELTERAEREYVSPLYMAWKKPSKSVTPTW
jgi:hypothetical protein